MVTYSTDRRLAANLETITAERAKAIIEMGYGKEEIWADAAEPKSIDEMSKGFDEVTYDENNQPVINHYQLPRIRPALKGADSIQNGIQRMQSFRIHVHPRCINTLIEFNNYAWDTDKDGNFIDKPIKEWDHCMDATRYALSKFYIRGKGHVVEVKGLELLESPSGPAVEKPRKSRRVITVGAK